MKLFLFSFLISFAIRAKAQYKIDYGEVKTDTFFNCSKSKNADHFNLGNICDAKNELEIRLEMISLPHGYTELIQLTFNSDKWNAGKYS